MTNAEKAGREEAIERLRAILKPGDTVYTVLRHVSRSGMQRRIDLYKLGSDGPIWLSGYYKRAMGQKHGKHDAVTVNGCGMDMGFHLVYELSYALYRDGFDCLGEECPSNDHSNGDRDHEPHRHSDPGYALKHRWM